MIKIYSNFSYSTEALAKSDENKKLVDCAKQSSTEEIHSTAKTVLFAPFLSQCGFCHAEMQLALTQSISCCLLDPYAWATTNKLPKKLLHFLNFSATFLSLPFT